MTPLLLAVAWAADAQASLEEALLVRALGDHETARSALSRLADETPADHPVHGQVHYWLARLELERRNRDGARQSFRACIRTPVTREVCADALGKMELEDRAVRELPTVWRFDGSPHGVVLPGQGRMEVAEGTLLWAHPRDPLALDTLLLGVDLPVGAVPERVSLTVTPRGREAWVGIVFVDADGTVVPAREGVYRLPADRPSEVEAFLRPPPPGLDVRRLDRVLIRDVSALNDEQPGLAILALDDLTVE